MADKAQHTPQHHAPEHENPAPNPYAFTHEPLQPSKRVAVTEVPPLFAQALDAQWEFVKRDQVVPVITFPDAKTAAFHLAYAKAWGLSKDDGSKVTVKKGPARKDEPEGTLRLIMEPYNPDAPKRGRKPGTASA
jgi:hypothetical protein